MGTWCSWESQTQVFQRLSLRKSASKYLLKENPKQSKNPAQLCIQSIIHLWILTFSPETQHPNRSADPSLLSLWFLLKTTEPPSSSAPVKRQQPHAAFLWTGGPAAPMQATQQQTIGR